VLAKHEHPAKSHGRQTGLRHKLRARLESVNSPLAAPGKKNTTHLVARLAEIRGVGLAAEPRGGAWRVVDAVSRAMTSNGRAPF